jgi:hypothetical protein
MTAKAAAVLAALVALSLAPPATSPSRKQASRRCT